jgi:hypothetical protein
LSTVLQSSVAGRALSQVELSPPPPSPLVEIGRQLGLATWQLEPGLKAHLGFALTAE